MYRRRWHIWGIGFAKQTAYQTVWSLNLKLPENWTNYLIEMGSSPQSYSRWNLIRFNRRTVSSSQLSTQHDLPSDLQPFSYLQLLSCHQLSPYPHLTLWPISNNESIGTGSMSSRPCADICRRGVWCASQDLYKPSRQGEEGCSCFRA